MAQTKKVKSKRYQFPETIFVTHEIDGKDDWLDSFTDSTAPGEHGDEVAIYELVEVKNRKITSELI